MQNIPGYRKLPAKKKVRENYTTSAALFAQKQLELCNLCFLLRVHFEDHMISRTNLF
jgi:hypothetical protein